MANKTNSREEMDASLQRKQGKIVFKGLAGAFGGVGIMGLAELCREIGYDSPTLYRGVYLFGTAISVGSLLATIYCICRPNYSSRGEEEHDKRNK